MLGFISWLSECYLPFIVLNSMDIVIGYSLIPLLLGIRAPPFGFVASLDIIVFFFLCFFFRWLGLRFLL